MNGGDAQALATLVRESSAAGIRRDALHLGLGAIPAHLRQPHHERLVMEALTPVLAPTRGRLFVLPNEDLVAVTPPGGPHLQAAQAALGALFSGQPAAPKVTPLALPQAAATLLTLIELALIDAPTPMAPTEPGSRFPSTELAAVERAIAGASLDAFVRRSRVCRLTSDDAEPTPLWTEIAVDMAALHAALLPGIEPNDAPALAHRLRERVDRRLLSELASGGEAGRLGPAGLTLSLKSIGEAAFLRFDAALGAAGRSRVVLWIGAADILAHAEDWAFVRAVAGARGYRLGLDAPSPATLALMPPDRLGTAVARLRWRPDLPPPQGVLPAGIAAEHIVLAGADRAAAIGWGWEAGITCFEGRLLVPRQVAAP